MPIIPRVRGTTAATPAGHDEVMLIESPTLPNFSMTGIVRLFLVATLLAAPGTASQHWTPRDAVRHDVESEIPVAPGARRHRWACGHEVYSPADPPRRTARDRVRVLQTGSRCVDAIQSVQGFRRPRGPSRFGHRDSRVRLG